ncbi:unnamed protein product [Pedinophyceae sp. YPF-701]|nr:unnamed protein product [Pedinophyceae sp. YPF-701]
MSEEGEPRVPQWEGPLEDGIAHGEGKMTYPGELDEDGEEKPGDTYEGNLNMGVRQGQGKYTWASGAYYDGEYNENKKHGEGFMKFPDGGMYAGQWKDDLIHGKGIYTYPNGDIYDGEFVEGKKHGKGNFLHKESQSQYVGEFKDGNFAGGQWILVDCTTYAGEAEELADQAVYKKAEFKPGTFEALRLTNDEQEFPLDGATVAIPPPPEPEETPA